MMFLVLMLLVLRSWQVVLCYLVFPVCIVGSVQLVMLPDRTGLVVLVLALFTGISSAVLVVAAGAVGVLTLFIPALNQAKGNEQDPKEGK